MRTHRRNLRAVRSFGARRGLSYRSDEPLRGEPEANEWMIERLEEIVTSILSWKRELQDFVADDNSDLDPQVVAAGGNIGQQLTDIASKISSEARRIRLLKGRL